MRHWENIPAPGSAAAFHSLSQERCAVGTKQTALSCGPKYISMKKKMELLNKLQIKVDDSFRYLFSF